jgi:hypothetical protein
MAQRSAQRCKVVGPHFRPKSVCAVDID